METLILKGKSKEDMKLIADLAIRLGIATEYVSDQDLHNATHEPDTRADWDNLSAQRQQYSADGKERDENESIIREFREKFE